MTDEYTTQVSDLTAWFAERLPALPTLSLTWAQYTRGVDALPQGQHLHLVHEAMATWLKERNYELSYNQMCQAFFAAAKETGKFTEPIR
jgi:hypothetical protein